MSTQLGELGRIFLYQGAVARLYWGMTVALVTWQTPRTMDGKRIARLREARGWNQRQLAAMVGVGKRTVQNWEADATVPRSSLGKLYEVFGIEGDDDVVSDPIREASDVELLAELMRRASLRDRQRAAGAG